jgi:hypothetical protein
MKCEIFEALKCATTVRQEFEEHYKVCEDNFHLLHLHLS